MDSIAEADTLIRRFEQQLTAFEKLHTDEVKGMEEKLAIYKKLHADEVQLMREELARLKEQVQALKAQAAEGNIPMEPPRKAPKPILSLRRRATLSRRDLLLGWLPQENKSEEKTQ